MHPRDQTIYALASGRPPSAIALVRMSGAQAPQVVEALTGKRPRPRQAMRALLRDSAGEPIDDAIVLLFAAPASATGEDIAEFHVHGGRAVLAALFAVLSSFEGVRAAEPGEFTRRAFENGKLDLTEAEALDDLIHSDTDKQRKQALRQLNGLLGDRAQSWRSAIISACALIEAGIDFAEEADLSAELRAPALARIAELSREIDAVLASGGRSERLRDGLVVAITGPPNVGKSTLLNQLARREAAIVSPHAGTTRDLIEVHLDLDGYPLTVIDTAGIRETSDPVEQQGVRLARARAAEADLVLWLSADDTETAGLIANVAPVWRLRNKIDILPTDLKARGGNERAVGTNFAISAARGDGLLELTTSLADFAAGYFGSGDNALIGRSRQRGLLSEASSALSRAVEATEAGDEVIAEELRAASAALGRLLGRIDVEDVLGEIFSEFCVGK